MPSVEDDLLVAFELHSVEAIRRALDAGADPSAPVRGKSPVTSLVEMYTRSTRFPNCLRLLREAAGREVPPLENVPNRYLLPKSAGPGA